MGKKANETLEEREKRLAYNREWHKKNKDKESGKRMERYYKYQRDKQLRDYRLQRLEVLKKMGGKCVYCKKTEEAVLTIDHVFDDGAKERKLFRNVYHRLRNALEIPSKYQILCFRCNHKKYIFGPEFREWPKHRTVAERLAVVRAAIVKGRSSKNTESQKDWGVWEE